MNPARVGSALAFDVTAPAELVLRIAAATPVAETLSVTSDGRAVEAIEIEGRHHLVQAPVGALAVTYAAEVDPDRPVADGVTGLARIEALLQSRYCPSDRLAGFAAREFGGSRDAVAAVRGIADWVFEHLSYEPGSSGPSTDAVDTMLSGAGVCRDYAHLMATLCRAVDVPARVVAVYAPGLSPMDFHLVVETALDGRWRVWDATRLAPRPTLIRIATGRDAADTALATTLSGQLTMYEPQITAVAAADLPLDDHTRLVSIA